MAYIDGIAMVGRVIASYRVISKDLPFVFGGDLQNQYWPILIAFILLNSIDNCCIYYFIGTLAFYFILKFIRPKHISSQ